MLESSPRFPMASSSPPRQRFLIRRPGQCQLFREPLGEALELEMVWIPPGRFWMGSPPGEPDREESEGPPHLLQLQGFFLGRTPITQAQWRAVAGWQSLEGEPPWERDLKPDPSHFKGDDWPVQNVSWHDSMEFCSRLGRRTMRKYTLPSEAHWEYACRAGSTTPFHFGATISPKLASYDASTTYAEGPTGSTRSEPKWVASYPANPWGLHDMHGNVWEWCLDHWHDSYAEGDEKAPTDGSAWMKQTAEEPERVLRGGSWDFLSAFCRSASRGNAHPDGASSRVGFRVCCLPRDLLLDP
jgi:formylglycine-generating enzyme required for sulfatase activity